MAEMEIIEENEVTKKCFKYKERLFGNLNIVYNEANTLFLLWNKYQIFLHEDQNFDNEGRVFTPDFQIRQLLVSNNYIVCLDYSGNIHIISLKFKNSAQKRFKSSFQPREKGISQCIKYTADNTLCLKMESDTLFLCLYKINVEFQLEKKVVLKMVKEEWPLRNSLQVRYILYLYSINNEDYELNQKLFNAKENVWKDHSLVLISFDKLTVYGCLFSHKSADDEIELIKLFTSPIEICDLKIIEKDGLNIIVGVTTGSIIHLPLKNVINSRDVELIHLNIPLAKFITIKSNETLIYTDGMSLWKAENIFSKTNIQFQQFFIKEIKDFLKYGDQLICTTYTNMIYILSLEHEESLLNNGESEYCAAETLLNNSEYVYRIILEGEKVKQIQQKIDNEAYYITLISLSSRQDLMDTIIQQKITVYEKYDDAINENPEITLTEELSDYFNPDSLLFLIQITPFLQNELHYTLIKMFEDLKIHITLLTGERVLKTTSIKLNEPVRQNNMLIPLHVRNITQISVEIKLVIILPGALDKKKDIWMVVYRKLVALNAEHFIKTKSPLSSNLSLKEPGKSIEELIKQLGENQYGDLFTITNIAKLNSNTISLSFYVKLPERFNQIVEDGTFLKMHFNSQKATAIQQHITSEEFLKSRSDLYFEIGNETVKLQILNDDFSKPLLKVSSANLKLAFDMRNFFANLFYNGFKNCLSGNEFVSSALYTAIENLQKAIRLNINGSEEEILMLAEQFQCSIIGALPV